MKTSLEYLDDAKKAMNVESDYALCKASGLKINAVSMYRTKSRIMDDFAAAKIAEILGIDPMIVIAAANAEREKGERKEYWEKMAKKLGGIAAGALFFCCYPLDTKSMPDFDTKSMPTLYIMLNR